MSEKNIANSITGMPRISCAISLNFTARTKLIRDKPVNNWA
jgi:hypothetical protein